MKILIVGLGSIGLKHVSAISKISADSTVYALRSSSNVPAENEVINIYDIHGIGKIDFAIISTPTFLHKETIKQLLSLKCPLFIEKPLYHTLDILEETKSIGDLGILNYVGCNLRFLDCLKFIKSEIAKQQKKINEINVYCGSYLPEWRANKDFRNLYSSAIEKGGGVHLDLIHELDYIYWFFGMPQTISKVLSNKSTLHISAPDYANYCLQYDTFCVSIILNYFRRDVKRSLEIVFDDYTWDADIIRNRVCCNNKVIFESSQEIKDTYTCQMEYFMELVKTECNTSFNTVFDALNVLKICLTHA